MSRTIHKHEIKDAFALQLPAGWKPLMVAMQGSTPRLWVELDTDDEELWEHHFQVFGTGHDLPGFGSHIGSWIDGPYVWHLYQLGSKRIKERHQ